MTEQQEKECLQAILTLRFDDKIFGTQILDKIKSILSAPPQTDPSLEVGEEQDILHWLHDYMIKNKECLVTYRTIAIMLNTFAQNQVARAVKKLDEQIVRLKSQLLEQKQTARTYLAEQLDAVTGELDKSNDSLAVAVRKIAELEEKNRGNNFLLNEIDAWFSMNNKPSVKDIGDMRKSIQNNLKIK